MCAKHLKEYINPWGWLSAFLIALSAVVSVTIVLAGLNGLATLLKYVVFV